MIAHAKAQGGSEADVDSVYLKGEEAILEHEKRNGYDKGFGPNGVLSSYGYDGRQAYIPTEAKQKVW